MQGTELALLLGICISALTLCLYRRDFGLMFLIMIFGDYFAIQGKIFFGYQFLGGYKELLLTLVAISLLFLSQERFLTSVRHLCLLGIALVAMVLSPDYRPFSALIIAAVAGAMMAKWDGEFLWNIPLLALMSLLICIYQYVNIKEMSDLWFFDFMADKAGDDFTTNFYAFFRNERVRPPGYLVSPSIFGFLFVLFAYLIEKTSLSQLIKYSTKLACLAALVMIQTRALLIIFLAYEIQRIVLPKLKSRNLLFYYGFVLVATLAMTILYGDEGALVRILLFTSLLADLGSGIGWLPLGGGYDGPVDSQFVAYVRLFGVPGIFALLWFMRAVYRQSKKPDGPGTAELSFFCVTLFINIFQWSGSSPGNLLAWMAIAFYVKKNSMVIHSNTHAVPPALVQSLA